MLKPNWITRNCNESLKTFAYLSAGVSKAENFVFPLFNPVNSVSMARKEACSNSSSSPSNTF